MAATKTQKYTLTIDDVEIKRYHPFMPNYYRMGEEYEIKAKYTAHDQDGNTYFFTVGGMKECLTMGQGVGVGIVVYLGDYERKDTGLCCDWFYKAKSYLIGSLNGTKFDSDASNICTTINIGDTITITGRIKGTYAATVLNYVKLVTIHSKENW